MKKIKFSFEYKCYPIWIYGEDGIFEDMVLPPELEGNKDFDNRLLKLQRQFDSTYIDTPKVFEARGFESPEVEEEFIKTANQIFEELKDLIGDKYILEKSDSWLDEEV